MDLILASTSPYRRQLLQRLQLPFRTLAPQTDEHRHPGEQGSSMSLRLARQKASAVATANPAALVIGCDQVASIGDEVIGKPGSHQSALEQLRASSGRAVIFHTGLALVGRAQGIETFHVEPFTVKFRELSDIFIENYLRRERPYDCAGSFKCEGLGIALFEQLQGNDPTSLEGLPLIALTTMLAAAGLQVLGDR